MATTGGFSPRPKLVFAAPLQLGMLAEHELADLFLAERLAAPALRARLTAGMPPGYRVVDLHDVWVGAPALAPQLVAADYRMTLFGVEREELCEPLRPGSWPRSGSRASGAARAKTVAYDLRPLIIDLQVRAAGLRRPWRRTGPSAGAAGLWMRLRHSQERGSGRADEVVAALADEMGLAAVASAVAPDDEAGTGSNDTGQAGTASRPWPATELPGAGRPAIEMVMPVRERLWLAEELTVSQAGDRAPRWAEEAASRLPLARSGRSGARRRPARAYRTPFRV